MISRIIDTSIPSFNTVLSGLRNNHHTDQRVEIVQKEGSIDLEAVVKSFTPPLPKSSADADYAEACDLVNCFEKTGLQTVIRISSIKLTPDNPDYQGGAWEIVGQGVKPIPNATLRLQH